MMSESEVKDVGTVAEFNKVFKEYIVAICPTCQNRNFRFSELKGVHVLDTLGLVSVVDCDYINRNNCKCGTAEVDRTHVCKLCEKYGHNNRR